METVTRNKILVRIESMENRTDSSLRTAPFRRTNTIFLGLNKRFFVMLSEVKRLYFLPGSFVILSVAKYLLKAEEILHYALLRSE